MLPEPSTQSSKTQRKEVQSDGPLVTCEKRWRWLGADSLLPLVDPTDDKHALLPELGHRSEAHFQAIPLCLLSHCDSREGKR
jgi:hypothetical protein